MTTVQTITAIQIDDLQREAAEFGDLEQVAICERARIAERAGRTDDTDLIEVVRVIAEREAIGGYVMPDGYRWG